MKIEDCFRINMIRQDKRDVIYQVLTISSDLEWVSAKIIHPVNIAEKLNPLGAIKIHVASLDIDVIGNMQDETIKALYG